MKMGLRPALESHERPFLGTIGGNAAGIKAFQVQGALFPGEPHANCDDSLGLQGACPFEVFVSQNFNRGGFVN